MCSCIYEIPERFVGKKTADGRKIISAAVVNQSIGVRSASGGARSRFCAHFTAQIACVVAGLEKAQTLAKAAKFCPFCGEKY